MCICPYFPLSPLLCLPACCVSHYAAFWLWLRESMKKDEQTLRLPSEFIFEPHALPFPTPAILLLGCSHAGLDLNENCIVSVIHSSKRVIELICLASVCWAQQRLGPLLAEMESLLWKMEYKCHRAFNDSRLDISRQAFHRKYLHQNYIEGCLWTSFYEQLIH